MRIATVAFTLQGAALARRMAELLAEQGHKVQVSVPARLADQSDLDAMESLDAWAAQAWSEADALLFVSACGIAVRAIAPHVRDKFTDPAVVCVDETGRFAIALLSGHVGGANALARAVAAACGGKAVITTATDVHGCFAVDEWAARQGLGIVERVLAKECSARLLAGDTVGLGCDFPLAGTAPDGVLLGEAGHACDLGISVSYDCTAEPYPHTLHLVPRTVTVGVGCRRGTSAAQIESLVESCLHEAHLAWEALRTVATIDVKADEEGLLAFAEANGLKLRFYSAEALAAVAGTFSSSDFVWQTVGVDNVCERAACAAGGSLVLPRRSAQGVTAALAVAPAPELSFDAPAEEGDQLCC